MNRTQGITLALFIVACYALGGKFDELDARQATADTVLDRAAESAQLQADVLFAEASRP